MGTISSDLGSPFEETNSFAMDEQNTKEKKHLQDQINFLESEIKRVEHELTSRIEVAFNRIESIEDEI